MKRALSWVLTGCGVLAVSAASAQSWPQDPYHRNDPYYRNNPNYRNGGYSDDRYSYEYGRNSQYLIERVMSDLDQAARRARLDGHEMNHFNEVARNLGEFQSRWARGKFEAR